MAEFMIGLSADSLLDFVEGASDVAREPGIVEKDVIYENNPSTIVSKEANKEVNDLIEDGLHELPIFRQAIDAKNFIKDEAIKKRLEADNKLYDETGFHAKDSMFRKIEGVANKLGDYAPEYKKRFGVDGSVGNLRRMHATLTKAGYKPDTQEQAVINKLVSRQDKVFEIADKYDDIIKKGIDHKI